MNKASCLLLSFILIQGCADKNSEFSGFFCNPENNTIDITVDSLKLECIRPIIPGCSYIGYSGIFENSLFFADALFSTLFQFDRNGEYINAVIRNGNGPHEIPVNRIEAYYVSNEGHHYFLDSSTNLFEFDKDFTLVNQILYYWGAKIQKGNLYEKTDSYTTSWGDNVNLIVHDGIMYTNIYGEADDFNITVPDYYKTARIIEPRDVKTGQPLPLLGRISPAVGYMTAFQNDFFEITDRGDFVVAYEADDLIYVYDSRYRLKYSFGQPGTNMNRDYKTLSVQSFREDLIQEQETRGRYTSLDIAGDYIFRTYVTGKPNNETRLQIYDQTTLIGDIQVPDGFKVLGYISPYYYSAFICDADRDIIELYRFQLLQ